MKKSSAWSGLLFSTLIFLGCQAAPSGNHTAPGMGQAEVATKTAQDAATPEEVLSRLRAGNDRFVSGHPLARNVPAEVQATASGQYPYAVVLSCLDSRQPVELIFDQGIGDLFSARVAGNVLNDDMLGSMEFACKVSGAKLIVVLGHTDCGAIKGAINQVELGNLTGLLAKIRPAISKVAGTGASGSAKNPEFVQQVADANVRLVMDEIRRCSPILREMIDQKQIGMVGGMYDLRSGKVVFNSP